MRPFASQNRGLVAAHWFEMLAQATAVIAYPPQKVAVALAAPAHPWSIALDGNGRDLVAKVGITCGEIPIYKEVQLRIGERQATVPTDRIMLPVSWEAIGGPPIFPRMEGTLHVEGENGRTRLTLNAVYDPPFGRVGELIDRAVMHRLAEITMNDFMERLARALSAELDKGAL